MHDGLRSQPVVTHGSTLRYSASKVQPYLQCRLLGCDIYIELLHVMTASDWWLHDLAATAYKRTSRLSHLFASSAALWEQALETHLAVDMVSRFRILIRPVNPQ